MFSIKEKLANSKPWVTVLFASLATFFTYSCMYAYRKAFTSGSFADAPGLAFFDKELTFKTLIVISQLLGYTLSKFLGIKIISEASNAKRQRMILMIIGVAWISLIGFALAPVKFKPIFMFLNGLPLGMVWGLVFSFIEGRRFTEMMGAALCTSFALASGFAKTVGSSLVENYNIGEYWMPFATGALYFIPLVIAVWMLGQIPPPTAEDIAARMERLPMTKAQRRDVFRRFAPGLVLLIITYVLLSAFRDYRDNFQKEIFVEMGFDKKPAIFAQTESIVSFGVLAILAMFVFISDNKRAFFTNKLIIVGGLALAGVSTLLFTNGIIGPIVWMTLTGFATYIAYIPFNAFLFERFIAVFKLTANAGFLIYLADSFGYLGSVSVTLYKDLFSAKINHLQFFINANYILAIVGAGFMVMGTIYFTRKLKKGDMPAEVIR